MAFDDGQEYTGVIIGREKKKGAWKTGQGLHNPYKNKQPSIIIIFYPTVTNYYHI